MKKTATILLCAGLLLTSLVSPAYAVKDNYRVKISGTSSDMLSGYYVEFDLNGTKYRSDEMGAGFNSKMWGLLDEADRRKVMKTYAFAPWARKDQFGMDGSAAMCDYINDVTGWKQAAEVLRKRVEERYGGDLMSVYGDNGAHKNEFIQFCPEVSSLLCSPRSDERYQQIAQKLAAIDLLYSYGLNAYNCLVNIRYQLTQLSVKAISGDLIQIITDKALVPNITPAGSGGAITSIATNTFDLINSLTGMTDNLTEKVIGKRASSSDVAEIVSAFSQIADADYQIALNCKNQIQSLVNEINSEVPEYYANLDKAGEKAREKLDEATQSYEAFKENDPGTNETVKTTWDNKCPKPPTAPKRENYSSDADYNAAVTTYNKNYEIYEERFEEYKEDASNTLSSYASDIEDMRQDAQDFLDTYADRYPEYQGVYEDEPWMITSHMIPITAGPDDIRKYEEVRKRRIAYNKNMINVMDGILKDAEELLSSIESSYPAIVANARGVCEGVNPHYQIGNYYYNPDYIAVNLQQLIISMIYSKDRLQKENEYIDEVMDNFYSDRKVWLDECRKKADAYREAQNNYILAAVYYDRAFSNTEALIEGLPDYVKAQRFMSDTDSSPFFIEQLEFSKDKNPVLYSMLQGKTQAQRDAECRRLGAELEPKLREYLKYQRQMKAAQNYMTAYQDQILSNAVFGGDPEEFARNYEGIGAGLMTTNEIFGQGQMRYLTKAQRVDAAALRLLSNDLNGHGTYLADMELLYSELSQKKSSILRNHDYDLYRTYSSKYSSLISNARYYSVLGFGENDKYAKKTKDLLDYISEKLNNWDYVSVTHIRKKNTKLMRAASDVNVCEAETAQLYVDVFPEDATEKDIVWATSNPDIADVDENGKVTGISCGDAVITAYALDSERFEVYETDENGNEVLNEQNKPIIKGYRYEPEAVTFTVTVTENPSKPQLFDEPAAEGYMWQNFASPSNPEYTKTENENGTITVTATLKTQNTQKCTVFLALYNADNKVVGMTALSINNNGEFDISVSCPEDSTPLYAKAFILGSAKNILNPISKVPFTENIVY